MGFRTHPRAVARRTSPIAPLAAVALGTTFLAAYLQAEVTTQEREGYACRLSILNGGQPREHDPGNLRSSNAQTSKLKANPFHEARPELELSHWRFSTDSPSADATSRNAADLSRAIPLSGDFNGDGQTNRGVYIDGEWFIDLNNNGQWDEGDLWASLGSENDRPVVGDWDGDGKADIGVLAKQRSPRDASATTKTLPDADNRSPKSGAASPGRRESRLVRRTARGTPRADDVDFVLFFDEGGIPIAGDFNGDGIDTIAVFRDGLWFIDVDGDGLQSELDNRVEFGAAGDLPIVGDFDGDGIDQIAVYRQGLWLIDSNGNRQLDDSDVSLELGRVGEIPIVGNWSDEGADEPAVFQSEIVTAISQ